MLGAVRQSPPVFPAGRFLAFVLVVAAIAPGDILACAGRQRAAEAAAATATVPAPVLLAAGAAGEATVSNNQVKIVRAPAGLVVAYAGMAGGISQVFLAVSRDDGARWSLLAQVSSNPAPSRLPAIALDGEGRVHVIWTRYDDGVGAIYHRVWAGRWIAAPERISPAARYAGYPAIALDRAGDPQVVWYGIREGPLPTSTRHGSIYEIFYTGFDGRAWSRPLLISPGLPDSVNPALAADGQGRMHAVWYQYTGRAYQVRYAERDRNWTTPEGVYRTRSDEFNPDLAVDAGGRVSLVWEHHDGDKSFIYYAQRTRDRWGPPVALTGGVPPARHPSVAVTLSGIIYVLWDQDDGQISLRRYAGRWEPALRLTGDGGNTFPSVAADGGGADTVWTHSTQAGSAVYFVRVSPP